MSELRDLLSTVDENTNQINDVKKVVKILLKDSLELRQENAELRNLITSAFAAIGQPLEKLLKPVNPADHPHAVKIALLPMVGKNR